MDRFGIKPIPTLSDSSFHEKIIRKYQKGRINALRFPQIIFCKKKENSLPKNLSIRLLFHINIRNKNILPSLNVKTAAPLREIFSWLKAENILPSLIRPNDIFNVNNETNIFLKSLKFSRLCRFASSTFPTRHIYTSGILKVPFLKPLFVISETLIKSNKIIKPSVLISNNIFHNQPTNIFSSGLPVLYPQISNNIIKSQIIDLQRSNVRKTFELLSNSPHSTNVEKNSINRYQILIKRQMPSVLSQSNQLFDNITINLNRILLRNPYWTATNKPLFKNYNSAWHTEYSFFRKKYAYEAGEDLHFHDQRRIDKEIEEIKNIIIETRKSILEKPIRALGETDIKRYIDINRISTQVYQDIERRIRMERERRGM